MLKNELCHALMSAYPLGTVKHIEQIHNGNNRVFRLRCLAAVPYDNIAVKVAALGGERSLAGKRIEKAVLDCLHDEHAISFVPRLLPPAADSVSDRETPAALLSNNNTLISCYRWADTRPYRGAKQQLVQVGKRYAELQRALSAIRPVALPPDITPPQHWLLHAEGEKFRLTADFTFSVFDAFIKSRIGECTASAMLYTSRAFLESEIADLHNVFDRSPQSLQTPDLRLIHQELSPSNFGFARDHSVSIIFDFDSISYGLPLQDVAWLCATFCIDHRKQPDIVTGKLAALLSSIASVSSLPSGWRDLLVPFMRLGYLDTIHRKIGLAENGLDIRLGFVREDIACLRWLREHGDESMHHVFAQMRAAA